MISGHVSTTMRSTRTLNNRNLQFTRVNYEGTVGILADRETVWQTVRDPEVLTACVKGAEEIEQISDREYEGVIRQTVAGIGVEMNGELQIQELEAPRWLRFNGVGSDTRTGSRMEIDATVEISEGEPETALSYDVEVTFTGKLASLGSRVLRRQIRTNIDAYFDNLAENVDTSQ